MRNVEISRVTQQLLCSKSHDFLAIFALAHSKINQIAEFWDDNVRNHLNFLIKPIKLTLGMIFMAYLLKHRETSENHFKLKVFLPL